MDKINDQDFRTVMTEAYLQYHEAMQRWEEAEWVLRDQTNEADRRTVSEALKKMETAKSRLMAVLGTMTEVMPYDRVRPEIRRLLEEAGKRVGIDV